METLGNCQIWLLGTNNDQEQCQQMSAFVILIVIAGQCCPKLEICFVNIALDLLQRITVIVCKITFDLGHDCPANRQKLHKNPPRSYQNSQAPLLKTEED